MWHHGRGRPDRMAYEKLVLVLRDALGRRTSVLHAPPAAVAALARAPGVVMRDILLTAVEIRGPTGGCWSRASWRSGEFRSSNDCWRTHRRRSARNTRTGSTDTSAYADSAVMRPEEPTSNRR